jgi:hypothetical protein
MINRLLVLSIFGFLGCAVLACDDYADGSITANNSELIMADNNRKERRDDRQGDRDDKQDCRQEEGRVGDDKRECKQENRGDGDKDNEGAETGG